MWKVKPWKFTKFRIKNSVRKSLFVKLMSKQEINNSKKIVHCTKKKENLSLNPCEKCN